jgi:methionyl-tRNA formyltransferase
MGTPRFAVPTLEKIVEAGHAVAAVYTQPDRPKGRGGQAAMSPVKKAALRLGLPVHQPERVRRPEVIEELSGMGAQAMVVVGYGQIIPQAIIDLPQLGIVNVHASLLPKYRGAAPIQWAIANGETKTGVTTMRIDAGLDTGDMLLAQETAIDPDENAVELSDRLSTTGADLLVETLAKMEANAIVPIKQDDSEATLAPILKKEDGLVDWNLSAAQVYNRYRGFLPWPGAYTTFRNRVLHIAKAKPAIGSELAIQGTIPGSMQVSRRRLFVTCGNNSTLELLEVQLEGRKIITADAFVNGQRLIETDILGEIKN